MLDRINSETVADRDQTAQSAKAIAKLLIYFELSAK